MKCFYLLTVALVFSSITYAQSCDTPLDLPVVQDAINNGCTELIYAFTWEGTDYININIDCEGNGIIYNCSENTVCTYNSNESLISNCGLTVEAISNNPPSQNNIIWSKSCDLETTGTIEISNYVCGPGCDGTYLYLALADETDIFPVGLLTLVLLWEYGYQEVDFTYAQAPNLFFKDNYDRPLFPLSYIICTTPLDECYPCDNEPYQPVCGQDGNTYDNDCFADCAGVEVAFEGSCNLTTCDTPLQLPFVQNAINEGCAELIHTATDNGRTYISVNKNCDGEGLIYDCTNGSICTYTDYETLNNCETDVPINFSVLLNFYYDLDNIVWSKPCNYEYEGIVEYEWFACGPACDGIIYYVILNNGSRIFPYQQSLIQDYEGRYIRFSLAETANLTIGVGYGYTIPSQHITCLESVSVEPCPCSRTYEPVCSIDGKTYLNNCIAECAGVEIEKEEACENQICIDPLALEIVQNAINSGCTEIIYQTLSYGVPYIVIDKNCENETVVYDCNSGEICTINSAENSCDIPINLYFNFDDVIWSTPCTYEYEGYVRNEFYSCGPYCNGIRYFIILNDGSKIYPLQGLQSYWGKYIKFSRTETTNVFFETEEGDPLPRYYITCFEPLNEESCTCEFDYTPVCGTDGTTYLNSCIAECIGVSVEQADKCDCTPPAVGEFSCE